MIYFFFFSSRRRHTRLQGDWSSDLCSSDLTTGWGSRGRGRRPPRGSVAVPRARVGEGPSGSGNELPGIGVRAERELQHAVGVRHGLGVRRDGRGHGGGGPTPTYVELTDPPRRGP